MEKNPYLILGIEENASYAEIQEAFNKLKAKYNNEMLQEGAKGREAAIKYQEVIDAFNDIKSNLETKFDNFGKNENNEQKVDDEFLEVYKLIMQARLDDAQRCVDNITVRGAQWHYYQAAIYAQRTWFNEALTQINMSLELDPENENYKVVKSKLELEIKKQGVASGVNQESRQRAGYRDPIAAGDSNGDLSGICCPICFSIALCDCCCR